MRTCWQCSGAFAPSVTTSVWRMVDDPAVPGVGVSVRNAMVMLDQHDRGSAQCPVSHERARPLSQALPRMDRRERDAHAAISNPHGNGIIRVDRKADQRPVQRSPAGHFAGLAAIPMIAMDRRGSARPSCGGTVGGTGSWGGEGSARPAGRRELGPERGRVPQMWNWKEAVEKRGAVQVTTALYDGGLQTHSDVVFPQSRSGATTGPRPRLACGGIIAPLTETSVALMG
jgi:hypothetical protein